MTPINIILISDKKGTFAELEKELANHQQFLITYIDKFAQVTERIQKNKVDVVVVAEQLGSQGGFEFVQEIVKLNPFINCALASSLAHDDFHELTEGYGIFMQLSSNPTRKEGTELFEKIAKLYQLAGETL